MKGSNEEKLYRELTEKTSRYKFLLLRYRNFTRSDELEIKRAIVNILKQHKKSINES